MNPDGNRRLEHHYANHPRMQDPRYPPNYPPMAPGGMPNMDNYIMQLNQMMYHPLSFCGFPYPNNPFLNSLAGWRDPGLVPMNYTHDTNSFRSYSNPQNMRVVQREMREKPSPQIIDLQLDEEEEKQKNVLVPPNNNTNKTVQKPALVINIDDNSDQKVETAKEVKQVTELQKISSLPRPLKSELRLEKSQAQKLQELIAESKTKPIYKNRHREHKIQEDIPSKEKRRSQLDPDKQAIKNERLRDLDRLEKKKSERVAEKLEKLEKSEKADQSQKTDRAERGEKSDRFDRTVKADKIEKGQKQKVDRNRKQNTIEVKTKYDEVNTKEIAKYLESHGQIRHGKQFQSDIPSLKITTNINLTEWLSKKRQKILSRQVGALTY